MVPANRPVTLCPILARSNHKRPLSRGLTINLHLPRHCGFVDLLSLSSYFSSPRQANSGYRAENSSQVQLFNFRLQSFDVGCKNPV